MTERVELGGTAQGTSSTSPRPEPVEFRARSFTFQGPVSLLPLVTTSPTGVRMPVLILAPGTLSEDPARLPQTVRDLMAREDALFIEFTNLEQVALVAMKCSEMVALALQTDKPSDSSPSSTDRTDKESPPPKA